LSEPEQTPPRREQRDVPWWQVVDEHAAALESDDAGAPDPWADVEPDAPSLTSAQRAFLLGEDQPPVPRLTGGSAREPDDDADADDGAGGEDDDRPGAGRETGKSPGDNPEGPP
jgi:hypothetical protein